MLIEGLSHANVECGTTATLFYLLEGAAIEATRGALQGVHSIILRGEKWYWTVLGDRLIPQAVASEIDVVLA